jgi:hypothetical protein
VDRTPSKKQRGRPATRQATTPLLEGACHHAHQTMRASMFKACVRACWTMRVSMLDHAWEHVELRERAVTCSHVVPLHVTGCTSLVEHGCMVVHVRTTTAPRPPAAAALDAARRGGDGGVSRQAARAGGAGGAS